MGVAAEIVEHLPGAAERRFRIDDPFGMCSGCEPCGEGARLTEWFERGDKGDAVHQGPYRG